jgi:hypothetical protein
MTDDEAILMVEAEIDRQQARTRAQRIVDAAKHEYTRWRCRKRGIPVDSNRCKQLMQRAEAVIMRTTEAAKPIRPFVPEAQSRLLTEAADESGLAALAHFRTDDDGQEWGWITYGTWEDARRHYRTTGAADG